MALIVELVNLVVLVGLVTRTDPATSRGNYQEEPTDSRDKRRILGEIESRGKDERTRAATPISYSPRFVIYCYLGGRINYSTFLPVAS